MRRLPLVLAALVATSCSLGPSAGAPSTTPSVKASAVAATTPSPTPATISPPPGTPAPPYAVIVNLAGDQYTAALVSAGGAAVTTVHARERSAITSGGSGAIPLPEVSASTDKLYYLDGDTDVRVQAPGGQASALVAQVPGGQSVHSAFAVSPDDNLLAVAVLDYTSNPVSVTLYVQSLGDGSKHTIFTSASTYVWPVGWHGGSLIVAASPTAYTLNASTNPYYAFAGYHLVDPSSGLRLGALCGGGQAAGPLIPSGDLCYSVSGHLEVERWAGGSTAAPGLGGFCYAVSPSGTSLACGVQAPSPPPIAIVDMGTGKAANSPAAGLPQGWIDDTHLAFTLGTQVDSAPISIYDTATGRTAQTTVTGAFAGVLPGGL